MGRQVNFGIWLVVDKFKFLPMPDEITNDHHHKYSAEVMRDCLCMFGREVFENEFWFTKEYGIKESWIRVSIANSFKELRPLCLFKDTNSVLPVLNSKGIRHFLIKEIVIVKNLWFLLTLKKIYRNTKYKCLWKAFPHPSHTEKYFLSDEGMNSSSLSPWSNFIKEKLGCWKR